MSGLAEVRNDRRQGLLDHSVLEPFPAAGLALLDDTVDNVRAVADLAVAGGAFCQQLAADQVGQNHGHRGGTDIDGAADDAGILGIANFHAAESAPCQLALDTDPPPEFPEGRRQLDHHAEGNLHLLNAQRFLHRPGQALDVRHGVVQARLRHGDHGAAEVVCKLNAAGTQIGFRAFENGDLLGAAEVCGLHPGLVGAGNVRHQHGAVAVYLGTAAQPPALVPFLLGNVAALQRVQRSLRQLHPAFAAGTVAGARRVNSHVGTAGSFQQIVAEVALDGYGAAALNLENHFAHVMFSFRLNFYVNYGILTETIQLRENPPAGKGSTYENLRTDY